MSGPPKFRDRDPFASLAGEIDLAALIQIGVWACGGLWVFARLYPSMVRRGIVPPVNPAQALGALFIAALTLSLWESPGILLTAFTLGQFAVMLGFVWVFTHRPHPEDPNKMYFDFWSLMNAPNQEIPRPEKKLFRTADGDTLAGVCEGGELMDEDLYNLPRIQQGMRSSAFRELHLGTQEVRILHFHDTLMRYLEQGRSA